jgi:hypothetical protein
VNFFRLIIFSQSRATFALGCIFMLKQYCRHPRIVVFPFSWSRHQPISKHVIFTSVLYAKIAGLFIVLP